MLNIAGDCSGKCERQTNHRYVECPEFSAQFTVYLKSDLLRHTAQLLLCRYRPCVDHLTWGHGHMRYGNGTRVGASPETEWVSQYNTASSLPHICGEGDNENYISPNFKEKLIS